MMTSPLTSPDCPVLLHQVLKKEDKGGDVGLYYGKVAIVTGAASGIGKAVVLRLLREGATVVAADYNEVALKDLLEEVPDQPCSAVVYEASSWTDAQHLVQTAVSQHGWLDVVFANAGIFDGFKPLLDTDEELWDRVHSVNLKGYFLLAKAAMPKLLDSRGALVFTASTAGFESSQGGVAYTAAKHGVVGLIHELAYEYAPFGVRVNGIAPGGTQTSLGMLEGEETVFTPEILGLVRQTTPLRQYGRPEFAADTALFLGSHQARHITGEIVRVDGGYGVRGFPYPHEQPPPG
jgi:NAD(P)-dependent dehydrogenase (short-subunit alcohol dehydrogenase family)